MRERADNRSKEQVKEQADDFDEKAEKIRTESRCRRAGWRW
jgi:hypothetical protein